MLRRLFFILFLIPSVALCQYNITGKVIDSVTKKPIAHASVFLNNTSAGSTTEEDGSYDITKVRNGHYELVVSIIGYSSHHQNITVNKNINLPDIVIKQLAKELKEVTIGVSQRDLDKYFAMFKEEFLGNSANASQCKILNPDIINIHYTKTPKKEELTATTRDFIEIENKALGYKIKYLLSNFSRVKLSPINNKTYYGPNGYVSQPIGFLAGRLNYEGSVFFEEMKGSEDDLKKWQKARLKAYQGSSKHFLKSVIADRVAEEGFTVQRMSNVKDEKPGWHSFQKIEPALLPINNYVKLTDQPGEYAFYFKDRLLINNNKKAKFLTSVILKFPNKYAYFDNNGVFINPIDAIIEGTWGDNRIADLLPEDYEPPVK
jgi:hypothetical protein